jgi:hypothetical protein
MNAFTLCPSSTGSMLLQIEKLLAAEKNAAEMVKAARNRTLLCLLHRVKHASVWMCVLVFNAPPLLPLCAFFFRQSTHRTPAPPAASAPSSTPTPSPFTGKQKRLKEAREEAEKEIANFKIELEREASQKAAVVSVLCACIRLRQTKSVTLVLWSEWWSLSV